MTEPEARELVFFVRSIALRLERASRQLGEARGRLADLDRRVRELGRLEPPDSDRGEVDQP